MDATIENNQIRLLLSDGTESIMTFTDVQAACSFYMTLMSDISSLVIELREKHDDGHGYRH